MASISTNKSGVRRIIFAAADGRRRAIYLGTMPRRAAETIKAHVESINSSNMAKSPYNDVTARWIGELDAVLYEKLVKVELLAKRVETVEECSTLLVFIDAYIKGRSDVKGATATVYGHTRRCLVNFFGAAKPMADVTKGAAKDFKRYLSRPKSRRG